MLSSTLKRTLAGCIAASVALGGCGAASHRDVVASAGSSGLGVPASRRSQPRDIHAIRHVIVVMQENRSFDSYFGTFPGADGIPRHDGHFMVCLPDRAPAAASVRTMTPRW